MKPRAALLGCIVVAGACTSEVSAPPREVLGAADRAAIADVVDAELRIQGALLDDAPPLQPLSATVPVDDDGSVVVLPPLEDDDAIDARRWPLTRPLQKLLRSLGVVVSRACIRDVDARAGARPSWVDADGDGIPSSATLVLACASEAYAVGGAVRVLDDDDTSTASGFWVSFADVAIQAIDDGVSATTRLDGSLQVFRGTADPVTAYIDRALTVVIARGQPSRETTFVMKGAAVYTGDAATAVFARGTLTGSARTTITRAGATQIWTWRTDPSLRWNLACKRAAPTVPGFDAGAALWDDARGNTVRVAFASCGSWSVALDGAAL